MVNLNLEIKYIKNYGIKLEILQIFSKMLKRLKGLKRIQIKISNIKHKKIMEYLKNNYSDVIKKYDNKQKYELESDKIWIFWWQGLEKAPEIVKKCIKTIERYSDNVNIITKANLFDYVTVEPHILKKFKDHQITITHFSDVIRMKLLAQYGGYWLDATIFLTDNVFEDIMGEEFYTPKLKEKDNLNMISRGRWCVFFIGGKNIELFKFVNDFFVKYWKEEELVIDYFLMDYIIAIAYENIDSIKIMIDNNKENNLDIFKLNNIINNRYDEEILSELIQHNKIHKLSYKQELLEKTGIGEDTFYRRLVKENE